MKFNLRKILIFVFVLVSAGELTGQWLTGYVYRKKIEISGDNVYGAADLAHYPLLVSLIDPDLKSVGFGGLVHSENGWDIRFTADDATSLLDHETELYTDSTGQLIAWVRIPVLNNDEETEIYMYFGNPDVATDPSTTDTWNNSYHGVWHLGRSAADASQYSNDGTVNEALPAIGKIGYAYAFDGIDDNITINNSPSLNITGDISLQAWGRVTDPNDTAWILTGKSQDYWIWYDWNRLIFFAGDVHLPYTVDLNPNEWYHFAGTHDGSTTRLYLDGIEVASVANSNPTSNDSSDVLTMGIYPANPDPWNYTGEIDELRLLSVPLSGDWIRTSYSNQDSPESFLSAESTEPVNDFPCGAVFLPSDTVCSTNVFTTQNAGDSGLPISECDGYSGGDVWFKAVVPAEGLLEVRINSDSVPGVADTADLINQAGLAVYTGTCGSLTYDTCLIDSEAPFDDPQILLTDHNPGDTLFLRIWEHGNDENGKFNICITIPGVGIYNVSGSGSYCIGTAAADVQLDGSQAGVSYQLLRNGIEEGAALPGTGGPLTWSGLTEGVFEVKAYTISPDEFEYMEGRAVIREDPLPVVTMGYEFYKIITIKSDSVSGTADLTDFPLLVNISADNELRHTGNGGRVQDLNGYDIVFTDSSFNPLPFEKNNYEPATGSFSAWVRMPSVSASEDTRLYMLYGKPGINTDHSSWQTWSDEYKQVLHLDDDFTDASSSGNFGHNTGAQLLNGKLGTAAGFDGTDDVIIVRDDSTLTSTTAAATFSLWIRFAESADGDWQIVMTTLNRFRGVRGGYEWASQNDGDHFFYPNGYNTMDYNLGPNPFTDSVWHYLAVTQEFSTKEVKIYVDGVPMSFTEENVPGLWNNPAILDDWWWGGNPDIPSRYFLGEMDEIRVQTRVRSEAWLRTEYINQNNPDGFYSVSAENPMGNYPATCMDAEPVALDHAKPTGGNYSGPGVTGGFFDPAAAGAGDHLITYNYTAGSGCSASGSETRTVSSLPAPDISGSSVICSASPGIPYSTADVPGHSYNWVITGTGAVISGGQGTSQVLVDWGSSDGTLVVTETNDASGCDSTSAVFYVSIGDTTDPSISCLENRTEYYSDNCEFTMPDYSSMLSYSDNCDTSVNITQVPSPGTIINGSGTLQEIILTARDIAGNESECRFDILLQDDLPPALSGSLRDTTIILPEGVYETYVSLPKPVFTDNCGIASVINDFSGGEDASGEYAYGTTMVTYTVTDDNDNVREFTQQVTLQLVTEPEWGLVIPEGFSPNEDGLNDRFEILGLEQYPDNELRVFNVHGNEVYYMAGYDNTWDGTSASNLNKGGRLPTGTYYYALYLRTENAMVKGFVYLRRE